MVIKQKVKYKRTDENGKKRYMTEIYCGTTEEMLLGRVEKGINLRLHQGWELR